MVERFTRGERTYHWLNALAVFILGTTGFALWWHFDKFKWHGLEVVQNVHYWLGAGLLSAASLGFMRLRRRHIARAEARFSVGQRFNLRAFQAMLSYMVLSGLVVEFKRVLGLARPVSRLILQTHLYSAMGIAVLIAAHVFMVLVVKKNRGIVKGMWHGHVERQVLQSSSPTWLEAVEAEDARPAEVSPTGVRRN
jgi:cytochrome b subunit of formate dehydrogenase